jgi:hypothetical protein
MILMRQSQISSRRARIGVQRLISKALKPKALTPLRLSFCSAMILVAALTCAAQPGSTPGGALRIDRAVLPTPINQPPDVNTQMEMHDQHGKQQSFAAANAERRRQISQDSEKLLRLAADLNADVSRKISCPLPPNLIRKIDELEKLAHIVKEKMKLSVGPG